MEFDLDLPSGRVRAQRWGRERDPLFLCVHGLTANLKAFAWLAEGLVRLDRQVVAIDCRGRGRSEVTAPGSYGVDAHARDVIEVARRLGPDQVSYIGWSMGAMIGMCVAEQAAELLEQLVLIDFVGPVDPEATALVRAALPRLDAVVSDPSEYVGAIRARGVVEPWTPFWTELYTYELGERGDGTWSPTTDRAACEEDLESIPRDFEALWGAIRVPTTLIRAAAPIAGTRLVADDARDAFAAVVADLTIAQTRTNHYTVMTDPAMLAAL